MAIQTAQSASHFSHITNKLNAALKQFSFLKCNSRTLLKESLRVRHEVYCSELRWEQQKLSGYEQDRFDANATHYLACDRTTQRPVATFRIVSGQDLPVTTLNELNPLANGEKTGQNLSACEVSRLSILKSYRNCELSDGLMLFAAYTAFNKGFDVFYSMMEHRLARKLKKLHIDVSQITDSFEHRGTRAIYRVLESDLAPLISAIKDSQGNSHQSDVFSNLNDGDGPILACA